MGRRGCVAGVAALRRLRAHRAGGAVGVGWGQRLGAPSPSAASRPAAAHSACTAFRRSTIAFCARQPGCGAHLCQVGVVLGRPGRDHLPISVWYLAARNDRQLAFVPLGPELLDLGRLVSKSPLRSDPVIISLMEMAVDVPCYCFACWPPLLTSRISMIRQTGGWVGSHLDEVESSLGSHSSGSGRMPICSPSSETNRTSRPVCVRVRVSLWCGAAMGQLLSGVGLGSLPWRLRGDHGGPTSRPMGRLPVVPCPPGGDDRFPLGCAL